ncbi:UDP-glucosyl transferase 73B1 [Actinidia rufa]|uniref:UDP-glucosyl transferase 73B1 n=1 Tax=Actinidia rufa TaxID=165716 RepID=A0A7J0F3P3_9ERIC|nr:UDP-glucosyl transferase 73B1 [Actinidia rufa]
MAPGHFIPMVDMAKLLAQHGVTVTVITTPLIAARLRQTINHATASGLPIWLLHLPFPSLAAGLPEGSSTTNLIFHDFTKPAPASLCSIPTYGPRALHPHMNNFVVAIDMLQQPFEQLFQLLEPKPSCMIADKHIPWVTETGRKFRLPTIIFDGMSCFTLLCTHNLHVSKVHESLSESEPFVLPGLPDTIEVTKSQLPGILRPVPESLRPVSDNLQKVGARVRAVEEEAYGMVVNSFEELEPRYMNGFRKIKERLWCIGPLSLSNKDNLDKAERGNKASIDENQCLKWLDTQESGTVIYACLGTLSRLTLTQLVELGSALELSKHPFVWVIEGGDKAEKLDKWMEEDGFKKRTKERGLIIQGWAPQVLVLDHPAVGAFLTHCGWNSTLEGVCAGLPMITWPLFADQFFNEKLVVKVLETGVSVGAQAGVNLFEEDNFAVLIKREAIKKAVDEVLDAGIKREERRKRARELGERAKRAAEKGGSSYLNRVEGGGIYCGRCVVEWWRKQKVATVVVVVVVVLVPVTSVVVVTLGRGGEMVDEAKGGDNGGGGGWFCGGQWVVVVVVLVVEGWRGGGAATVAVERWWCSWHISVPPLQPAASMASQKHYQLHFVLFSLMAPGHFIPMVDMAKLLAQYGATVTVITFPLITARLHPAINCAAASGLPIQILHIPSRLWPPAYLRVVKPSSLQVSRVHKSLSELEPFVLPGLPDTTEMTKSQQPRFLKSRQWSLKGGPHRSQAKSIQYGRSSAMAGNDLGSDSKVTGGYRLAGGSRFPESNEGAIELEDGIGEAARRREYTRGVEGIRDIKEEVVDGGGQPDTSREVAGGGISTMSIVEEYSSVGTSEEKRLR